MSKCSKTGCSSSSLGEGLKLPSCPPVWSAPQQRRKKPARVRVALIWSLVKATVHCWWWPRNWHFLLLCCVRFFSVRKSWCSVLNVVSAVRRNSLLVIHSYTHSLAMPSFLRFFFAFLSLPPHNYHFMWACFMFNLRKSSVSRCGTNDGSVPIRILPDFIQLELGNLWSKKCSSPSSILCLELSISLKFIASCHIRSDRLSTP